MTVSYSHEYLDLRKETNYEGIIKLAQSKIETNEAVDEDYYWYMHALLYIENTEENIETGYTFTKKIHSPLWLGMLLKIIGNHLVFMGNYQSARENYSQATDYFKNADEEYEIGNIYNNLGFICINQGDLDKALQYYDKAIEIFEDDPPPQIFTNMGKIYRRKRDYNAALEQFLKAEHQFSKENMVKGVTETKFRMIRTYCERLDEGDLELAKNRCDEIANIERVHKREYMTSVLLICRAVILLNERSLVSKGKAMELFYQIKTEPQHEFQFKLVAYKHIIELKLAEMRINETVDQQQVIEFNAFVDEFYTTVSERNMHSEMIDLLILKSKFAEFMGDYTKALDELEKIPEIIKNNNIAFSIQRWKDAETHLSERIKATKDQLKQHSSIVERMKTSYIEDYLKMIKL